MKKINKNKNYFTSAVIVIALFAGIIIQSCQTEDKPAEIVATFKGKGFSVNELKNEAKKITAQDISKLLYKHYGISHVTKLTRNTSQSKISKLMIENVDQYEITEFTFGKSNQHLYIAQNTYDKAKYLIVKTVENKQNFNIVSKVDLYGNHLISNSFEEYNNGSNKIKEFKLNSFSAINSADPEWCQQEPEDNGSRAACEDREYEEFTEEWVGWVAYWTNPLIAVLISAQCRC